jgi:hypothetical protein
MTVTTVQERSMSLPITAAIVIGTKAGRMMFKMIEGTVIAVAMTGAIKAGDIELIVAMDTATPLFTSPRPPIADPCTTTAITTAELIMAGRPPLSGAALPLGL